MSRMRFLRPSIAVPLAVAAIAAPAQPARAPALTALGMIEPGQWQLRPIGVNGPSRSLCVIDPDVLLQVRHGGAACSRFIIANEPNRAIVQYTCPGAGYGRTTIEVETGRLFQLDSQGIADNAPFAVAYEGRRTGACTR